MQKMLERTGALAALGFTKSVDWMESTAAELLLLHNIQQITNLDSKGLKELQKHIKAQEVLFDSLGFKLVASPKWYRRPQ